MKVNCPNCGEPNEASANPKVTCFACTAIFDAPPGSSVSLPGEPSLESEQAISLGPDPWPDVEEVELGPDDVLDPTKVERTPTPGKLPTALPPSRPSSQPGRLPTASHGAHNRMAIASFVAGLLFFAPFVAPMAAVIAGIAAIQQIDQSAPRQQGKGLAIAGIILGSLQLPIHEGALMFVSGLL